MMPRVAIIYICHKTVEYVPEVVAAIAALHYPKDRLALVFIPNGSPDNVVEVIERDIQPRAGKDLPPVILLNDGRNHGFGKGNNQGMRWAIDQGFDYVFLHNGDLTLDPEAINNLVELAEHDERLASVQCLVSYWHEHDKINVSGGMVHVAGYGFARDNGKKIGDVTLMNGEDIAYASGAATLYRVSALQKVGLLEEGFFMYHEDLELGMRLRFAGYRNVLCTKAKAFHDYSFRRNPMKFAWMELYRSIVVLAYYRLPTLLVFWPLLFAIELGTWAMALKGGWLKAKVWALAEWCKPRTWRLLFMMRARTRRLRTINDATFLTLVTGKILDQEGDNLLMEKVINPVVDLSFRTLRLLIKW